MFRPLGERMAGSPTTTDRPEPTAGVSLVDRAEKPSVAPSKVQTLAVFTIWPATVKPEPFQAIGPDRSTTGAAGAAGASAGFLLQAVTAPKAATAARQIKARRFTSKSLPQRPAPLGDWIP